MKRLLHEKQPVHSNNPHLGSKPREKSWARFICLGHCPAQKITLGKSNNTAASAETCELEKILLEFYIKMYYYSKTLANSVYEESLESIKNKIKDDNC